MTKSTEVTKKTAAADVAVPDYIKQDSSRGNENVSSDDLQLPRLDVLQALSPQVNKKKESYIEGAEVGMLFNTLTGELYADGVRITPISFKKSWLIWVNRKMDSSGGLRGVYDDEHEANRALAADPDRDKLEVVPTAEHLVLLDDGSEVILSMSKSKMKVSRKFNSLVRLSGGDRFSRSYMVTSVEDEGAQGEYQNLNITQDGFPSKEVYLKAEELYNAMAAGEKQQSANYSDVIDAAEGDPAY